MPDHSAKRSGKKTDVKNEPPAASSDRLPSISRLDNRSFVTLFQRVQELDRPQSMLDTSNAQCSESPVSPLDTSQSHGHIPNMAGTSMAKEQRNRQFRPLARGDSTVSSLSSKLARSETFSNASDRSSTSSLALDQPNKPAKKTGPGRWIELFAAAWQPDILTYSPTPRPTKDARNPKEATAGTSKAPPTELPPYMTPVPKAMSIYSEKAVSEKAVSEKAVSEKTVSENVVSPNQNTNHTAKAEQIRPSTSVHHPARHTKSTSVVDAPAPLSMKSEHPPSPVSKRGARLGKMMSQRIHKRQSRSLSVAVTSDLAGPTKSNAAENRSRHTTRRRHIADISLDDPHTVVKPIPADTAEDVVFQIMYRLPDLKDLQSTAMLSRGFYVAFKRHESTLVNHILRQESPPAWEMMQLLQNDQQPMSIRTYSEYRRTLDTLRSTILVQCESSLKGKTFAGLIGADTKCRQQIDRALWRIWVFCERFGQQQKGSDQDLQLQVDWVNGGKSALERDPKSSFGQGNGDGLSIAELTDIGEMWHCLGLVLQGFQNRVEEARWAGVFRKCDIDEKRTEEWYLREWILYLRCLGPAVVSSISSCSFEQANALGLFNWSPPSSRQESRRKFLKSAITTAYQKLVVAEATMKAAQMSLPNRAPHRADSTRAASGGQVYELDTPFPKPPTFLPSSATRKPVGMICTNIESHSTTWNNQAHAFPLTERSPVSISPASNSTMFHSLSMTPTASAKLSATLFPVDSASPRLSPRISPPRSPPPTLPAPQPPMAPIAHAWSSEQPPIIDPADKAMALLVHGMGFAPAAAKRALASCDTGFGMDVDKAIQMLAAESWSRAVSAPRRNGTASPSILKGLHESRSKADLATSSAFSFPTQQQPHTRNQENVDSILSLSNMEVEADRRDSEDSYYCGPEDHRRCETRSMNKAYRVLGVNTNSNNIN